MPKNRRAKGRGRTAPVAHKHGSKAEKRAIETWLRKSGYPLEMEVARAFAKAGFSPMQSGYYRDPETQKPRELDVSVGWAEHRQNAYVRLTLPVQCKMSARPWALFCPGYRQTLQPRGPFAQAVGSPLGRRFLMRVARSAPAVREHPFIAGPRWAGYSVTEGMTTGKDAPYEAAITVAKACQASVDELVDEYRVEPIVHLVFPVIVVDSSLYACYLGKDGKQEADFVPSGLLVWQHPSAGTVPQFIYLVTRPYLSAFVAEVEDFRTQLLDSGVDELATISQRWYKEHEPAP